MEKERIDNVIKRITTARTKKGLSYENMAHELSITPAAYRKTEIGETKLTVERLFQIAEILDEPLTDLLEIGDDVFQQTNNENAIGCYQQKIENFYQESKEATQSLVANLKDEITHLKSEIEFLRGWVGK